jgi:hypothetical protein
MYWLTRFDVFKRQKQDRRVVHAGASSNTISTSSSSLAHHTIESRKEPYSLRAKTPRPLSRVRWLQSNQSKYRASTTEQQATSSSRTTDAFKPLDINWAHDTDYATEYQDWEELWSRLTSSDSSSSSESIRGTSARATSSLLMNTFAATLSEHASRWPSPALSGRTSFVETTITDRHTPSLCEQCQENVIGEDEATLYTPSIRPIDQHDLGSRKSSLTSIASQHHASTTLFDKFKFRFARRFKSSRNTSVKKKMEEEEARRELSWKPVNESQEERVRSWSVLRDNIYIYKDD